MCDASSFGLEPERPEQRVEVQKYITSSAMIICTTKNFHLKELSN